MKAFGRDICNGKSTLKESGEDQSNLLVEIMNFKNKTTPQDPKKEKRKKDIIKYLHAFFDGREKVLDAFENKIFPIKT